MIDFLKHYFRANHGAHLRETFSRIYRNTLLSKLAVRAGEPPWGMVRSRPPSFDTINRQEGPP
jgi:hypothetical protein